MKKLIVFITIALLIFGISACSPANKGDDASTIDKITDLSNKNDTTKTDAKEKVKLNPDELSDPTDLTEPEDEEPPVELTPFEEEMEKISVLLANFLEKENMKELSFSVYSNGGPIIFIQLFPESDQTLGQKIQLFEEDFTANGTLNSENRAEWDAIIETFLGFITQITQDFPDFGLFQILSPTDYQNILQINKDLSIYDHLTK
jgi:hypothetical protein